jgi:hypothetical protein
MQSLIAGHRYALDNFEGDDPRQILRFIRKEPVTKPDGTVEFRTVENGTTNEEVIRVLIDRIELLNAKASSPYNEKALAGLRLALEALEERTADRKKRGIEGTPAV